MIPHLPKHWVAGVYSKEEDVWKGEFYATCDEMLIWCEEEHHDELVMCLVLDLCECQKIYEEWWEKVRNG